MKNKQPDPEYFFAVLSIAVVAAVLLCLLAVPGCSPHRDDRRWSHEHGDPKVGCGPKNPCPCDRD